MKFIEQALRSALAYPSITLEVVVAENFSTDGTDAWLETITDPRVRVIPAEKPLSAAENWARACREARGTWLKIVPADDFLTEGGLDRQLHAAESSPKVVMVASRRRIVSDGGATVFRSHGLRGFLGKADGREVARRAILSGANPFGETSSVLFRRSSLIASLPFTEEHPYLTDLDMYVKVLSHGEFVGLATVDAAFRLNAASWSASIGDMQLAQHQAWLRQVQKSEFYSWSQPSAILVGLRLRARFIARKVVTKTVSFRWQL
jgi:glycosyltransferase involved in cell wall biosynthesis